jgi:hypothetical protein
VITMMAGQLALDRVSADFPRGWGPAFAGSRRRFCAARLRAWTLVQDHDSNRALRSVDRCRRRTTARADLKRQEERSTRHARMSRKFAQDDLRQDEGISDPRRWTRRRSSRTVGCWPRTNRIAGSFSDRIDRGVAYRKRPPAGHGLRRRADCMERLARNARAHLSEARRLRKLIRSQNRLMAGDRGACRGGRAATRSCTRTGTCGRRSARRHA